MRAISERNNPLSGAAYFARGLALIAQPGLRRYVVLPLLVNVVGLTALIYYGARQLQRLIDAMVAWLPSWLDWLSWLLWPLFAAAAVLVVALGFSLLANLIAAPFNGLLAEAVERRVAGGVDSDGGWRRLPQELAGALYGELRKLLYFGVRALALLLLFVVPGVNAAAPFLWFVFGAWILALEYIDFPMGNHGLAFPRQRRLMGGRRLLAVGFGAAVMLALAVPLLQFVVIPAAVAGATVMWVEQLQGSDRSNSLT
ncbi:MAG: sulfate transporter CysZ [Gammaproteobacteria bacterium]|nr:sulfate transporter CysZ [Gammaproteobacteria bacterium]NIR82490.1 sulfate transporter CysZ [Gammaproteobacteria bacterium]NIR88486.1 sulfate transporter CysZ [Gammaproteobacteria bacterium]NIU03626.1 sulfate transporter CysZ [Gammaproteobacteria bacterium]NIV50978.1 sulfate transporter CysZ [Gammaproteobacteria bacterium]